MDPITHALTGGLVSQTMGNDRKRFWIYCFLGDAPDIDVCFEKLGSWAYFIKHRGFLHSIPGIFPQALFYAFLFSRLDPMPLRKKFGFYSLVLFFHVMWDYLTRHGAPLFLPFTTQNFRADLVPAVALVMLAVMAIGLLSERLKYFPIRIPPKAIWGAWVLYFMVCFSTKIYAMKHLPLQGGGPVTLVPSNLNPFQWIAVEEDQKSDLYRVYVVYFERGQVMKDAKGTVPMPSEDPVIQASKASPLVHDLYLEDRWPTAKVEKMSPGWQVDWGTLLFSTRGAVRGKVRVTLDDNRNIIKSEHLFSFWNA